MFRGSGGAPKIRCIELLAPFTAPRVENSSTTRPTIPAVRPADLSVSGSIPSSPTTPGKALFRASVIVVDSWSAPRTAMMPYVNASRANSDRNR